MKEFRIYWGMEMFYILIAVVITQKHTSVQTHSIILNVFAYTLKYLYASHIQTDGKVEQLFKHI